MKKVNQLLHIKWKKIHKWEPSPTGLKHEAIVKITGRTGKKRGRVFAMMRKWTAKQLVKYPQESQYCTHQGHRSVGSEIKKRLNDKNRTVE